jgi:hypothetical protein
MSHDPNDCYDYDGDDVSSDTVKVSVEMTEDVRAFLFALLGSDTWLEAAAVWDGNPEQRKDAHAAIAKATGEQS